MRARDRHEHNPIAPPPKLLREWYAKLAKSGHRDIEYFDQSLLGISLQEPERAPDQVDIETTQEYYSRATEFLYAANWRGRKDAKRAWGMYSEGTPLREISTEIGTPLTTLHRLIEKLRAECDAWWEETKEERENPPPQRGRPRKENPRRMKITVTLTREEELAIRNGARRAGCVRSHDIIAWVRASMLGAARSVPYGKGNRAA